MRYLADTDWVIHYIRGVQRVRQRFDELEPEGIGLSIVPLAELYDGVFGLSAVSANRYRAKMPV